jgi:integrase
LKKQSETYCGRGGPVTDRREFGHIFTRKGSSNLWVRYRVNGKTYRESTGSTCVKEARKLLAKRQVELGLGAFVDPAVKRTSFEDLKNLLLDNYENEGHRSIARLRVSLSRLEESFGNYRAQNITFAAVERYKRVRLEMGAARSTVNSELSALSKAFKLAKRARLVAHIPPIDRFGSLEGFFETGDFRAVVAQLPDYLQPPIEFGFLTGWRVRSEVLPLQWAQIDFNAKTVRLEPGRSKNRQGRVFPFGSFPQLDALLCAQRKRTEEYQKATGRILPWVFHRNGQRIRGYRKAWVGACKRAGQEGRLVHDLRRTAVRNLERAGVSRSVAMKLTGHLTEAVFRRYAIVAERDLADGAAKLATLHNSAAAEAVSVLPLRGTEGTQSAAGGE